MGRNAGRFHLQFDTRELTRGDFASQMNAFAVGKQCGFFNSNYILSMLGENPIPGLAGNAYWMPVNMQDADFLIKAAGRQRHRQQILTATPTPIHSPATTTPRHRQQIR